MRRASCLSSRLRRGSRLVAAGSLLVGAPTIGACTEPFDPASLVKAPRVLAIVADPPEAAPGEDVRLTPLFVMPEPEAGAPEAGALEHRWRVCPSVEQLLGAASLQYGEVATDAGCGADSAFVIELPAEADGGATLPGAFTGPAFEGLEAAAATYGQLLPADTLRTILDTTGLPVAVELEVLAGGRTLARAFKRVALTRRESRGTNPPPPRFGIGDRFVSARASGTPFLCVPEDGRAIEVSPSQTVELAPDPSVEGWLETFPVIDVRGQILEAHEGAYYAWFSTDGRFTEESTHAPDAATRWTPPAEAGPYPLWLVVRDGHGGASACRAEVAVVAPE